MESLSPILIMVVFVAVFYFLLIRPEKKRSKEAQDMRSSVKVGDTVITIGGITGEVDKVGEETVTIYTGDCSIVVQKWAIRSIEPDAAADNTYSEEELEEGSEEE